jgi:protein-L-isoaspartate(D-aspartate) O-methyltransferase
LSALMPQQTASAGNCHIAESCDLFRQQGKSFSSGGIGVRRYPVGRCGTSMRGSGIMVEGGRAPAEGEVSVAGDQAADVERMEFQLTLRRRGISDQAVLRAMDEVPREYFVAAEFADSAYADQALPIACGQTISQPYVVAYMTEQLEVEPQHRVLEIGTGSGYQAAILSRMVREVVSIERYRMLANLARDRIKTLGYFNVTIIAGDGFAGAEEQAPFDRIIVTAAADEVPDALIGQLGEGGKLVLPLGPRNGPQYIVKISKTADGELRRENLIAVRFVPLLPGQAREL